jgi:hypothetical protein
LLTFLVEEPYLDGPGLGATIWNVFVLVWVLATFFAILVCAFKGRWWFMLGGLFFGPVAWYGAFQPALPGSRWANRSDLSL